jgi:hypothetical protein
VNWLDKYFSAVVRVAGVNLPMRGILDVVGSGVTAADATLTDGTPVTRLTITSGGGGIVPTGTGVPKIVGGVQQAAAALVVNADVSASAALAVAKLAPGTVGQVLTTNAGVAGWANPTGVSAPWHNVPVVEKLISYTLLTTDYAVVFTGASGGVTFTLPATPTAGDTYVVSNQGSVSCTVAGNGNTILGVTTFTLAVNQSITLTKSTSGIWVIQ